MIAKVESAACLGIDAYPVLVEADVSSGLPQLALVGLPDNSVREARERVRAAIKNSGFPFPPDKITINLAPADIKKEGPAFDLPIALGILAACDLIPPDKLAPFTFLGELALDGSLRPFKGAIVISESMKERRFIFPEKNAREASLVSQSPILAAKNLREVVDFLISGIELSAPRKNKQTQPDTALPSDMDFAEVRGQNFAKRAFEIAASGGHNLLLIGSPGSGKTMLSRRISSILPFLDHHDALEVLKIHSVAGLCREDQPFIHMHPFRAPHHSISAVAMAGGGSWPKPGEVSLAHNGVLFLDEFPEFRRDVIETLRAPLESGEITIARAKSSVRYPARIMLIAAMNPCPCGYLMDRRRSCRCSLSQIQKYRAKISGPILDRIDLHVDVPTLTYEALTSQKKTEDSARIRERVLKCREIQRRRSESKPRKAYPFLNARMSTHEIKTFASPDRDGRALIERAMKELRLSARGYFKILKVARTIADLEGEDKIAAHHIAEAIQYRGLDREW